MKGSVPKPVTRTTHISYFGLSVNKRLDMGKICSPAGEFKVMHKDTAVQPLPKNVRFKMYPQN